MVGMNPEYMYAKCEDHRSRDMNKDDMFILNTHIRNQQIKTEQQN